MFPYISNVILYVFILFSLLYYSYRINHGKSYSKVLYNFYLILFVCLGTFAYFTGDYLHYKDEISRLNDNILNPTHIEPIFVLLITWVGGDYTLWRLCVYIITFVLLGYFLKLVHGNNFHTLFWYSLFILPGAVSGRASIAIIAFFIATIYLIRKKYIVGLFFYVLAILTHKSILPLLLLLPFTRVKINNKIVLLLLPICLWVGVCFNLFLINFLKEMGLIQQNIYETYLEYDNSLFASIGAIISFFISVLPYNICVICFTIALLSAKQNMKNAFVDHLRSFTSAFLVFLLLSLCLFGFTNPMFYRYYGMLKYLLLLLLPYIYPQLYSLYLTKKNFGLLSLFIFSQIYIVSLSAYYEYCQ